VVLVGASFLFVIGGYMPCQNFASLLLNLPCLPIGSISIGVIYFFLAISASGASAVIRRAGEKKVLLLSAITYIAYTLSVSYIVAPVIAVTSIALGVGGALFNTAGGSFVAKNSDKSDRGLHSGIFNAFQQGSALPGSLAAALYFGSDTTDGMTKAASAHCASGTTWADRIVLGWNGDVSPYFLGLTGMCIAGMGFIVALREERHEEDQHGFKGVSVYALVSGGFS
jgi:MFS family permease